MNISEIQAVLNKQKSILDVIGVKSEIFVGAGLVYLAVEKGNASPIRKAFKQSKLAQEGNLVEVKTETMVIFAWSNSHDKKQLKKLVTENLDNSKKIIATGEAEAAAFIEKNGLKHAKESIDQLPIDYKDLKCVAVDSNFKYYISSDKNKSDVYLSDLINAVEKIEKAGLNRTAKHEIERVIKTISFNKRKDADLLHYFEHSNEDFSTLVKSILRGAIER